VVSGIDAPTQRSSARKNNAHHALGIGNAGASRIKRVADLLAKKNARFHRARRCMGSRIAVFVNMAWQSGMTQADERTSWRRR